MAREMRPEALFVTLLVEYSNKAVKLVPVNIRMPVSRILFSADEIEKRLGKDKRFWQLWNGSDTPTGNPCLMYFLPLEKSPIMVACLANGAWHPKAGMQNIIIEPEHTFSRYSEDTKPRAKIRKDRGVVKQIQIIVRNPDGRISLQQISDMSGVEELIFSAVDIETTLTSKPRFEATWNSGNPELNPFMMIQMRDSTGPYALLPIIGKDGKITDDEDRLHEPEYCIFR